MLVLIATDEVQRSAHDTSAVAVDGELVVPVVVECVDPACEVCSRSWYGLVSHRPTTTAMVVDRPGVDEVALRRRIHEWLDCQGVVDGIVQAVEAGECDLDGFSFDDPVAAVECLVDAHVDEVRAVCARFPVGTVVSRLGQLVAACTTDLAA